MKDRAQTRIHPKPLTLPPTQRDAVLLQTMKGQPDTTSKTHLPTMKRSRSMKAGTEADTAPPRRSARLHARQLSIDQVASLEPNHKPQIAAGAESASDLAALSQTSAQQVDVDQQQTSRAAEDTRQPYIPPSEPKVECEDQFYPASLLWKRHDSNSEGEHQPIRTPLTREALALFNKIGKGKGKKGPAPTPSDSTAESSTPKTISITKPGFAKRANENGILQPYESKPPANLDDIRKRFAQSRGTASPTESVFKDYIRRVGNAPNEATISHEFDKRLIQTHPDESYDPVLNQPFTGFPKNVGFNNGLATPQPDFVEGLRIKAFRPCSTNDLVDGTVLYKDKPNSLTLPHLAGEFKGPGKDMNLAKVQSAYDGAALVHVRNRALDSIGKPSIAGNASITTFTTDSTYLNLFAHYAAPSEDGKTEYHQYPIDSTNLTTSHQHFRQGYTQLRNAQDYAKGESYKLRDELKEHWKAKKSQPASLPFTGASSSSAATNAQASSAIVEVKQGSRLLVG